MILIKIDEGDKKVYTEDLPLILWNHRWEFDKNPEDFFNALFILKKEGLQFKVAILGESYKHSPIIFKKVFNVLDKEIEKSGCLSGHDYSSCLLACDILPVTSNHDFFGISVIEAVYSGNFSILPKRLTYPVLYNLNEHPELFYEDFNELVDKLRYTIINIDLIRKKSYKKLASPYDRTNLINPYDETIGSLDTNNSSCFLMDKL